MQVLTKSEAKKLLKIDNISLGEYEVKYVLEGGVFNPKIKDFNRENICSFTIKILVVEDK